LTVTLRMSESPTGAGGVDSLFIPKEELVNALTGLGVTRNAATRVFLHFYSLLIYLLYSL